MCLDHKVVDLVKFPDRLFSRDSFTGYFYGDLGELVMILSDYNGRVPVNCKILAIIIKVAVAEDIQAKPPLIVGLYVCHFYGIAWMQPEALLPVDYYGSLPINGDNQVFQMRRVQYQAWRLRDYSEKFHECIDGKVVVSHLKVNGGKEFRCLNAKSRDMVFGKCIISG